MWKILNQISHFGKQGIKKILKYNRYTRKVDTIKIQEKIKITSKSKVPEKYRKTTRIKKGGTTKILHDYKSNIIKGITKKILNFIKNIKVPRCDKVEHFLQQITQGPYYTCTICNQRLYRHILRLLKPERYNILILISQII